MNKYKKFIKEAYNGKLGLTMCQEWKQKIESEFPELLPKKESLEIGKWYRNDHNCIFFFDGKYDNGGHPNGYGIDCKDRWRELDINDGWGKDGLRLATEEEVTQALIKEAEKRGYKDGICVNSFVHNRVLKIKDSNNNAEFINYMNKLHFGVDSNLCVVIFYHGKWAEIIQNTITKSEAEKQLNAKIID